MTDANVWFNSYWMVYKVLLHTIYSMIRFFFHPQFMWFFSFIQHTMSAHWNWVTSHLLMKGKADIYIHFDVNLCIIFSFYTRCRRYVSLFYMNVYMSVRRLIDIRSLKLIFYFYFITNDQHTHMLHSVNNNNTHINCK